MILSELIKLLENIAKTSPDSLSKHVQINFDTGAFSEVMSVSKLPSGVVVLSEDENFVPFEVFKRK